MSKVRTRGTEPELIVRRVVGSLGRRFRTENRDLLGNPDLANRTRRWVVFVNGCFWHQHVGCARATLPRTNVRFWKAKLALNTSRDRRVARTLRQEGYSVVVVWSCQTRNPERLREWLRAKLPR
jgi:DNA mismatch endonuclease (patch repair protein)